MTETSRPSTWQSVAKQKQVERLRRIPAKWRLKSIPSTANVEHVPRTCGILSASELDITENYDATALAEAIAKRRLTCIDVTRAFCKRAALAQQLTNCLTEIFFQQALKRAEYLDKYLETHERPLGLLHGVPISLKDSFKIQGQDSSLGIAALALNPSSVNSPLVDILLEAGAVIYCKTNVPQTLMALDSENNLFGRTLNPINTLLTAGGSSGGEGALIRMRGSVLGVGTDIGGSIRIPAMCNGLYGIKPSANRVPYAGQESGQLPGHNALGVDSSAGPIAGSLRDCELFLKTVAAAKPWERDPAVIPGLWDHMDFTTENEHGSMTIGILHTDGLIRPLPPIAKILKEVSASLAKAGVRVIDIPPPPSFKDIQSLANAIFSLEGGNHMFDNLEKYGEPLTTWLAPRLKRKKPKTLDQARNIHAQRQEMMTEMLELWRQSDGRGGTIEIDAIVCPVAPHPVPPKDTWGGVSYTSSFVLLDCAAGTVPCRNMCKDDLLDDLDEGAPISTWDKANRNLWDASKIDRNLYLGSPLCVQVVAPRLQERRLYRAMEIIDHAVNKPSNKAQSKL